MEESKIYDLLKEIQSILDKWKEEERHEVYEIYSKVSPYHHEFNRVGLEYKIDEAYTEGEAIDKVRERYEFYHESIRGREPFFYFYKRVK